MAAKTVTITGGSRLASTLKNLGAKLSSGGVLRVGFLEGATYPAKVGKPVLSVAQVAFWNEFGTSRAPARPFFRTAVSKRSAAWGNTLARALPHYKYNVDTALRALGTQMQSDVRQSIVEWSSPPNAPATVARKGFNDPLIDTGTMQRKVDYDVAGKAP